MTTRYLIGITTGRSGSKSFAEFLNNQKDIHFSHEGCKLTFWPIFDTYKEALLHLTSRDAPIVGDISPFWVNYLDRLEDDIPGYRVIWLERGNLDQVVTSYDSYKKYDFSTNPFGLFPVFEEKYSREAVRRTVYLMNFLCECAEMQLGDRMAKVKMSDLNFESFQKNLLNWIGIPGEDHVYGMPRKNLRCDLVKKYKQDKKDFDRRMSMGLMT